ncbi:hypothetical protein ANACOL_01070 [Anaerotruncus colihominis DSM 17241]|uniref:Uncharacterized protein n=1 Tax=Anaerotruncus colihominis DSM 17241 TaxID=445972 RepID=B0P8I1_9FIRM|nr:hypothetical protein ANACOL_01070 [Anaerotruncus colihominis DSM 17241]
MHKKIVKKMADLRIDLIPATTVTLNSQSTSLEYSESEGFYNDQS